MRNDSTYFMASDLKLAEKICVECIERGLFLGNGPCHNLKIAYPKRCSWRRTSSRSLCRSCAMEGSTKILSAGREDLNPFYGFHDAIFKTSFLNVILLTLGTIWVFPKIVDTPKWMVKIRKTLLKWMIWDKITPP